jgi:CubicO group peptidase (beta-lactamase class C family)
VTSRLSSSIRDLRAVIFTPIALLAFITIAAAVTSVTWLTLGLPGLTITPSEMVGVWTGTLQYQCTSLRLTIHIITDGAGKIGVLLDSVDLRVMGVPMANAVIRGNTFSFHIPSPKGTYQATIAADRNTLSGTWNQDTPLSLVFTRTTATAAPTPLPIPTPMAVEPLLALEKHAAHAQTECGTPRARADGWQVDTPESVGLSSETLCPMVKWLDNWKQGDVHAVLVVRHDKLVFEHYFTGCDEYWGLEVDQVAFGPQTKHDERSVSKSVTALVVGIAIDRGWIKSIDQPVLSFFPEYSDLRSPEKNRITLRDLLTMSSGLEWHESDIPYTDAKNSENRMNFSSDPFRFALRQPVVAPPGKVWNYNSGSSELLGAILWKATGKPVDQLARTLLFEPLGITDVEWYRLGRLNLPSAAGGLRLRPRDLAKIGQLILQHGSWNGKQVVPASWIAAATAPQLTVGPYSYGYQFWLGRSGTVPWVAAMGLGGQRLFIIPALDLVVVTNAGLYEGALQTSVPLEILDWYVLNQPPKQHKEVAVNPKLFDAYVGHYRFAPNVILSITREGNRLFMQQVDGQKFELFPESDRDYFLKAADAQITFQLDSHGRGSGMILHQDGMDQDASRVQ